MEGEVNSVRIIFESVKVGRGYVQTSAQREEVRTGEEVIIIDKYSLRQRGQDARGWAWGSGR